MSRPKKQKHIPTGKHRSNNRPSPKPILNIGQALALAMRNHQDGNLLEAEKIYREILAINPHHAETLHALAIMTCQRGEHAAAVTLFQKAIHGNPATAAYHYNLGNALKDLGRFDEAGPCYSKALQLKPDYLEALNNLGTVLHEQGRLDEAISSYREALRITPDHAETLYNLAISLQSVNQLQDALLCYKKALMAKKEFPEVYDRLGSIFREQGNLDAAIGCFQQASQMNPSVVAYHFNLATAFKEKGNLDEAINCYQKIIELAPNLAIAYNNLGNILKEKRCYGEAIAAYNMAIQLLPDYAIAHGNLASALTQIGDVDRALASCHKAMEIKPDIPEVYMLLATLLFMTRNWKTFDVMVYTLLTNKDISIQNGNWLNILKALQAWMSGNLARCTEHLHAASSIQHMKPEDMYEKSRLAYYCMAKKLADYRTNSPHLYSTKKTRSAFMIGDSHCLSFANTPLHIAENQFTVMAKLIMGCKAYHLSQKEHNQYKEDLLRNIADVPDGATVILSFGEIDCRIDEGIFPAWIKKFQYLSLEEMVQAVAEGYLNFISEATNGRGFKLMIFGVPAPRENILSQFPAENISTYISIPRLWNKYLQRATLKNGWTFLDNYTLTCDNEGSSQGHYHLDGHHLNPDTLELLVSKHAITPHFFA